MLQGNGPGRAEWYLVPISRLAGGLDEVGPLLFFGFIPPNTPWARASHFWVVGHRIRGMCLLLEALYLYSEELWPWNCPIFWQAALDFFAHRMSMRKYALLLVSKGRVAIGYRGFEQGFEPFQPRKSLDAWSWGKPRSKTDPEP